MNSCCICGTIKNIGPYINKVFETIEKIGSYFDNYVIILYYDKSDDDTLAKLKAYQLKNIKLEFYVNCQPMSPFRTHNIAKGRNFIINRIQQKYSSFQYFIMMDCDDRCALDINEEVLISSLNRTDWDALSFVHPTGGYYDFWALSIRPYIFSCHHFYNQLLGLNYIIERIKNTDKNDLIQCWSAFNGFSIYRTDKFINCRYDGRFRIDYIPKQLLLENIKVAGPINPNVQQNEDCEHRHFHFQAILKNNARIMISPQQIFYLSK